MGEKNKERLYRRAEGRKKLWIWDQKTGIMKRGQKKKRNIERNDGFGSKKNGKVVWERKKERKK